MIDVINSGFSLVRSHLPTPKRGALGALAVCAAAYAGGIPGALTTLAAFGCYKLVTAASCSSSQSRVEKVQEKLKTELFKRLPPALKEELLAETRKGSVSRQEISQTREPSNKWGDDIEQIRKIAIRACLEGEISEKEMGYTMMCGMAEEAREKLPGVSYMTSYDQPSEVSAAMAAFFERHAKIPAAILGDISSREDAFLVVDMDKPFDIRTPYHHTANIGREEYPLAFTNQQTGQTRIYVFPPHIYERLLKHRYPENPEKPLFAIGTKEIETLSNNQQRALSVTGGTTIPTPNIEANEALSLPFYLHDCYHLDIDSAIGPDRVFWNGFGKHLLQCSKNSGDPDIKAAFGALGGFCLDKEFASYTYMPKNKNLAFLVSLIGLCTVSGKHLTDDQDESFQLIRDDRFAKEIQKKLLVQFKVFWNGQAKELPLRGDLTKEGLLAKVGQLKAIFAEQGDLIPPEIEQCLKNL